MNPSFYQFRTGSEPVQVLLGVLYLLKETISGLLEGQIICVQIIILVVSIIIELAAYHFNSRLSAIEGLTIMSSAYSLNQY